MAKRIRSIQWCEGKIVEVLSKREITTYLALSAWVLRDVRSVEEQHNLDIALALLLSKKEIFQERDEDGFTVYKIAA